MGLDWLTRRFIEKVDYPHNHDHQYYETDNNHMTSKRGGDPSPMVDFLARQQVQ